MTTYNLIVPFSPYNGYENVCSANILSRSPSLRTLNHHRNNLCCTYPFCSSIFWTCCRFISGAKCDTTQHAIGDTDGDQSAAHAGKRQCDTSEQTQFRHTDDTGKSADFESKHRVNVVSYLASLFLDKIVVFF